MSEWQPIETAPKDGTMVLIWRKLEKGIGGDFPAHAAVDEWRGNSWYRTRPGQQPTHWMPLPSPPTHQTSIEGEEA